MEEKYQSTENMGEPKSKRESKYRSEYNILGRCLPWGETISKLTSRSRSQVAEILWDRKASDEEAQRKILERQRTEWKLVMETLKLSRAVDKFLKVGVESIQARVAQENMDSTHGYKCTL